MARALSADVEESAPPRGVRLPGDQAPYYVATGDEVEIFAMCHERGLPEQATTLMVEGQWNEGKTLRPVVASVSSR